jgi:hypothetical protein
VAAITRGAPRGSKSEAVSPIWTPVKSATLLPICRSRGSAGCHAFAARGLRLPCGRVRGPRKHARRRHAFAAPPVPARSPRPRAAKVWHPARCFRLDRLPRSATPLPIPAARNRKHLLPICWAPDERRSRPARHPPDRRRARPMFHVEHRPSPGRIRPARARRGDSAVIGRVSAPSWGFSAPTLAVRRAEAGADSPDAPATPGGPGSAALSHPRRSGRALPGLTIGHAGAPLWPVLAAFGRVFAFFATRPGRLLGQPGARVFSPPTL